MASTNLIDREWKTFGPGRFGVILDDGTVIRLGEAFSFYDGHNLPAQEVAARIVRSVNAFAGIKTPWPWGRHNHTNDPLLPCPNCRKPQDPCQNFCDWCQKRLPEFYIDLAAAIVTREREMMPDAS